MRVLVIDNPVAGGGHGAVLREFLAALTRRDAQVDVLATAAPGDATALLQARSDQGDLVVAVGGDGTVREVINALQPGVPLGVLPVGTANVLAQELNLPAHPDQAAALMLQGQDLPIYPARCNGRRFLMWAGVGYDAWVVAGVNPAVKRLFGKLAYVMSMGQQFHRFGQVRYRVTVDGQAHEGHAAIVSNARHYGGRFILTRQTSLATPGLRVLLFQKPGRLSLLRCLLALPFGRVESVSGVLALSGRDIAVEMVAPDRVEPVQLDGDLAGTLPLRIQSRAEPIMIRVAADTHRRLQARMARLD